MTWMDRSDRCMPYPEMVERRHELDPYRIVDTNGKNHLPSNGMADKRERMLYVPLSADGRPISNHEMAHVAWSPDQLPHVRFEPLVLHAVEDARINMGLARARLKLEFDHEQRTHVRLLAARDLKSVSLAAVVLRTVASLGTNVEPDLRLDARAAPEASRALVERLVAGVERDLERARRRDGGVVAPFKAALRVARKLARELSAYRLLEPRHRDALSGISFCLDHGLRDERRRSLLVRCGRRRAHPDGQGEIRSGEMTIVTAPLVEPHRGPGIGRTRSWRPGTEGGRVGRPHRWFIDGAIFRRAARRRGGSVLIDTSGSMHLGVKHVDGLLAASRGAAMVAIYSGREAEGELRIVARDGRRAPEADLQPYGGGNVVDLPALEWLARQPGPRIWVSDGHVTGVSDAGDKQLKRRCDEVARRGRIRRVGNAKAAAKLLAGSDRRASCV